MGGDKLTERQVDALRQYDNAEGDFWEEMLLCLGMPWSRQIKDSLVKRGLLSRNQRYPGVCRITGSGKKVLAEIEKGSAS